MDTIGNNRGQTDKGILAQTLPAILANMDPVRKARIFDIMYALILAEAVEDGYCRTENMAEDYVAISIGGKVVQMSGYDIIDQMLERTQVKTTGTRLISKSKQAAWIKHTASVKIKNFEFDYLRIILSLNHDDGSSTPIQYLMSKDDLFTKSGTVLSQLDFSYGVNASLNNRCQWFPYLIRDEHELASRYESKPILTVVYDEFEGYLDSTSGSVAKAQYAPVKPSTILNPGFAHVALGEKVKKQRLPPPTIPGSLVDISLLSK